MFVSVNKSVKGRVPAGRRGAGAFGTEWVGIGLRKMVMKVFKESHMSAKFIEISSMLRGVGQKERPLASNCVSS